MTNPNWGLLYANGGNGGFQNALAQGFQMGSHMRERREHEERRNALADYYGAAYGGSGGIVATPEQQAETRAMESRFPNAPQTSEGWSGPSNDVMTPEMQRLLEVSPDVAGPIIQQRREQQQEQQMQDLTRRAIGGDETALNELAVQNLPAWRALSSEQRDQAKQETERYGNAALDVLNLPPQQRGQAIMAYAQQFGSEEIAAIANMPPEQQEMALRAAVADANMIQRLHQNERPDYMAIPQGGTLVDTRNPQAVQQFGQGGGIPTINTPEEAANLAPGQQYRAPDGSIRVRGGTAGNSGGGF